MNLLQNYFIRQLYMAVLGTLFFMANCAFILIPAALGSTPGRPAAPSAMTAQMAEAEANTSAVDQIALIEAETGRN
jgi:hypothetical protein